ncbi:MAG TPA: hypothetical protein P5110_00760 [Candidatus Omnitrophota bacterium]|nr:hypothetical protein [Candidatus Omnitrophota bacterium]
MRQSFLKPGAWCNGLLTAGVLLALLCGRTPSAVAGEGDLEYVLDAAATTIDLPEVLKPSVDISGRGFHFNPSWPQTLASPSAIESWQSALGFSHIYRLQYNLWEISGLAGNKELQNTLLSNYEKLIRQISQSGGAVILNIFSIPPGQGKVLDKKSSPVDVKLFKQQVKDFIRYFSCTRRYTVWYEVWSAPDLDDFFLGRQQEYLSLYKAVAESVSELEREYKLHIPVGGPSSSWWFRNAEGNTVLTPERSLVYELIRFAYHNRLPLDFISWHAYSSDQKVEKENTAYNKHAVALIREWLGYFNLSNVRLIVDEWNFDTGLNISPERSVGSCVAASYIPGRLKNMYEAGIDAQVFFSLEDFQDNKEGVQRNVGAFWFTQKAFAYEGGPKPMFTVFKMLSLLGPQFFPAAGKFSDDFVGVLPTRGADRLVLLVYNYSDPDTFRSVLSRSIAHLNEDERRSLLDLIKSDRLDKVLHRQINISGLRLSARAKNLLNKALELNDCATRFAVTPRNVRLIVKNFKEDCSLQRYVLDAGSPVEPLAAPREERILGKSDEHQIALTLAPYSVELLVFARKPKEEKPPVEVVPEQLPPPQEQPAAAPSPVPAAVAVEPAPKSEAEKKEEPAAQTDNATVVVPPGEPQPHNQ